MDRKTLKAHLCATATPRVAKIIENMISRDARLNDCIDPDFPLTWEDYAESNAEMEILDRLRATNKEAEVNHTPHYFLSIDEQRQLAKKAVDLVIKSYLQAAGQHEVDYVFKVHGHNASHVMAEVRAVSAMREEATKFGIKFDTEAARAFAREAVEYRSLQDEEITEEDW